MGKGYQECLKATGQRPPGGPAFCGITPAMVTCPLLVGRLRLRVSSSVPPTSKTMMRGPLVSSAARRLPSPSSLRFVT